jgi:hypothetical protein
MINNNSAVIIGSSANWKKIYDFNVFLLKIYIHVQSRAINFGRQGHSLTQSKMLDCKTVVNIITYYVV